MAVICAATSCAPAINDKPIVYSLNELSYSSSIFANDPSACDSFSSSFPYRATKLRVTTLLDSLVREGFYTPKRNPSNYNDSSKFMVIYNDINRNLNSLRYNLDKDTSSLNLAIKLNLNISQCTNDIIDRYNKIIPASLPQRERNSTQYSDPKYFKEATRQINLEASNFLNFYDAFERTARKSIDEAASKFNVPISFKERFNNNQGK